MIVADTGAVLALVDGDDRHQQTLADLYRRRPAEWVVPWAVLPEIDYLLSAHVGAVAERLRAGAIATLDVRHFGAVEIEGRPRLLPRDL